MTQLGAECLFALLPLLQGSSAPSTDLSDWEAFESMQRASESEKLHEGKGLLGPAFAAGGTESTLERHRAEMGTFFRNMMGTDYQGWTPAEMHERFGMDLSSRNNKYLRQALKRVSTAIQATNAGTQRMFDLLRAGYSVESFLAIAQRYLATLNAEMALSKQFAEMLEGRKDIDPQKRLAFSQTIIAGSEWIRVARNAVENHMRMLQTAERKDWVPGLVVADGSDIPSILRRQTALVTDRTRRLIGGQPQHRESDNAA